MRTSLSNISQSLLDEYLVYKVGALEVAMENSSRSLFPSHLLDTSFEPKDWLYPANTNEDQPKYDTVMAPVLQSTPTEYWLARSSVTERVPDHPALSQWLHKPDQPEEQPTQVTQEPIKMNKSEPSLVWLASTSNNNQDWLSKSTDENSLWLACKSQNQSNLANSQWLAQPSEVSSSQWLSKNNRSRQAGDNIPRLIHGSATDKWLANSPTTTTTQSPMSIDMWLSDAMSSVDIHEDVEDEVDSGLSEGAGSSIVVIEREQDEDDFEDFEEDEDMSRWLAL